MSVSKSEPISRAEAFAVSPTPERFGRQLAILGLVLVAVGFISLYHLGQTPPTEPREMRIFDVISDMTQSGEYLVPSIKGHPHLTKPPLYYWLGVAATKVTGLPERVSGRLPSVLCALLLLAELFWFCRVLGQPRLAVPSVLALACFYEFYSNAHCANFDMLLAATSFLAVICFHRYFTTRSFVWLLATSGAMALALLGKATPAIPLFFLPVAFLLWQEKRLKMLLHPLVLLFCLALPLAVCLGWYLLILHRVPDAMNVFRDEGLLPFGAKVGKPTAAHFKPFFFFGYKIFKIAAPACVLIPLLVVRLVRNRCFRGESSPLRWLLFGYLGVVAIISIVPQKQEAYMLPLLPYLAILIADAALRMERDRIFERTVRTIGALGTVAFVGFGALTFFYFSVILQSTVSASLAAAACIGFAVVIGRLTWKRRLDSLLLACVCGWLFFASIYYGSMNVLDNQFKAGKMAENPAYSEAHWQKLFAKYPVLAKIFSTSTSKRFADDADSGN